MKEFYKIKGQMKHLRNNSPGKTREEIKLYVVNLFLNIPLEINYLAIYKSIKVELLVMVCEINSVYSIK